MYILIKQDLINVFGEKARGDFELLGISNQNFKQFEFEGKTFTIVEIIKPSLVDHLKGREDCIFLESTEEANSKILEFFTPSFRVTSEAVLSASLNQLVLKNQVDLSLMDPFWSEQEEYEFLYNNGVSGILKTTPSLFE